MWEWPGDEANSSLVSRPVAQIRQIEASLPHFFWPAEEEGEEDDCGDDGGSGRGDKARHEGHKGSHTREETEIPGEV